ncbi:hypothetical protein V8F33_011677 [Rhypophila sp. PSN 637]
MDPIGITSAVVSKNHLIPSGDFSTDNSDQVSTIATCLSVVKKLNDIREKYKDAPVVVVSICSESNVILASLTQMQMPLLQKKTLADLPPELPAVLDQAATGCMVVFSCLELEMQRMDSGTSQSARLPWKARFRFIWNETKLNELLGALRGQQAAVNLFLQLLQIALGDIKYNAGQAKRHGPDICTYHAIATLKEPVR